MKKFLYIAVAAIAALSSCSSDTDLLSEVAGNGAKVFTARFDGATSRATLNGMTPNWEADDVISINGAEYKAKTAGATSEFEATGAEAEGNTYTAYFPASLYNGGTPTLPATLNLTYEAGKFNMPMYATSSTNSLTFSNLCGVLAITVKSEQIAAVKSIKVSSQNHAVSGAFTVENGAAVLTDVSTIANTLTINYSTAVPTTAEGTLFYVAVPGMSYEGLKIELDADGNGFTKSMTTKDDGAVSVSCGKVYPITFADNSAPTPPAAATWETGLPTVINKNSITKIDIEVGKTKSGDEPNLNDAGTIWYKLEDDGKTLKIQTSAAKVMASNNSKFTSFSYVTTITGLENLDTSNMTDMSSMFKTCGKLASLDLSSFNTNDVRNMSSMFNACTNLTTLDLGNFSLEQVTNMASMFGNCANLGTLHLNNSFNVSGKYPQFMFSSCGNNCCVTGVDSPEVQASLKTGTNWNDSRMHFE